MAALVNAQVLTEDLSPGPGGLIVGCGEAAALMCVHVINGTDISIKELTSLIATAVAANKTTGPQAGYGQTAPDVSWDMARYGVGSSIQYGPFTQQKLQTILDTALLAGKPIALGVSQGHNLMDEEPGLFGHWITILGTDPHGGYLCGDPNAPQSRNNQFTTNDIYQLLVSQPFATVVPTNTPIPTSNGAVGGGGVSTGQTPVVAQGGWVLSNAQATSLTTHIQNAVTAARNAHKELPGFDGMAVALHNAERFHMDLSMLEGKNANPVSWAVAVAIDSMVPFVFRGSVFVIGFILIIMSLRQLIELGIALSPLK